MIEGFYTECKIAGCRSRGYRRNCIVCRVCGEHTPSCPVQAVEREYERFINLSVALESELAAKAAVVIPDIPYPGGHTQAFYWRKAASHLEKGFPVGGSNLTTAVIQLLRNAADAIEAPSPPEVEK